MTERKYPNKYGNRCYRCQVYVPKQTGLCFRDATGRWFVEHRGECPTGDEPREPRAPRAPRAYNDAPKPNQYGGKCANCGVYVPEREGRIVKTAAGWKAAHLTPEACETAKAQAAEQPAKAPARKFNVPTGFYAIPSRRAGQDLDFFAVNAYDSGKWAGWTFATEIIGGRERVRINKESQHAALEAIEAQGVEVSGKLYADKIGNCYRCNRLLTDEESRALGIGPVCRKDEPLAA